MATAATEATQKQRMSGPSKKGARSLIYGIGTLVGAGLAAFTGGLSALAGYAILGGEALYSGAKSAVNVSKSVRKKYGEKSGSYLGRGLTYGLRTIGTITVPWLQGLASILSGEERIRRDTYMPYDYPGIEEFEKELKKKEEAGAVQKAQAQ